MAASSRVDWRIARSSASGKRRQGSQVRTEQDGGIGRRRQTAGGRTCLEQLSVARASGGHRGAPDVPVDQRRISSITDNRRTGGLQHEFEHALEQRGLCELLPFCCCTKCRFRRLRHTTLNECFGCHEAHRVTAAAESLSCLSRKIRTKPHTNSNQMFGQVPTLPSHHHAVVRTADLFTLRVVDTSVDYS